MERLYEILDALDLPLAVAPASTSLHFWDAEIGYRVRCGVECAFLELGAAPLVRAVEILRRGWPELAVVAVESGNSEDRLPHQLLLKAGTLEVVVHHLVAHGPVEEYPSVGGTFLTAELELRLPASELGAAREALNALDQIASPEGWPPGPRLHFIVKAERATFLKSRRVDDLGELDLVLHYGDGMDAWHAHVARELGEHHAGLVLLHGPPGTGKTSYLRVLARELAEDKRMIFVPRAMLALLGSPEMSAFLLEVLPERPSVLVIEDAEAVLSRRVGDSEQSALTSLLLNLTDGLLNDVCKCQVVATFNIAIDEVDPALLRAGRLVAVREFGPLDAGAARRLAAHLGRESASIDGPRTLAELYASKPASEAPLPGRRRMGFGG